MLPNENWSVIEIAKLESSITGIMAGFALTIVVLLIERLASKSSDMNYDAKLGRAAIAVFVATFFTSTLDSFLFAVVAAELENSARAFLLLMPPAFVFALSSILLTLGLVLVLGAYKLDYALEPARAILCVVIVFTLSYYIYTASDVTAVMYKRPTFLLLAQPEIILPLLATPAIGIVFGFLFKRYRHLKSNQHFNPHGLRALILASVVSCAFAGVVTAPISNAPKDLSIPFWQVWIFIAVISILVGWSILYIPRPSLVANKSER